MFAWLRHRWRYWRSPSYRLECAARQWVKGFRDGLNQ